MVRISKQAEKRRKSPRKSRYPSPKTGPLKDALPLGYKEHENALQDKNNTSIYIAKIQ